MALGRSCSSLVGVYNLAERQHCMRFTRFCSTMKDILHGHSIHKIFSWIWLHRLNPETQYRFLQNYLTYAKCRMKSMIFLTLRDAWVNLLIQFYRRNVFQPRNFTCVDTLSLTVFMGQNLCVCVSCDSN